MTIDIEQAGVTDPSDGDDAFERAFLAHWPRLHSTLTRLVGDADEAEDLALETFWRLYKRPPRERTAGLGGWLHRVAMNLGFNALRARRRRQTYEQTGGVAWLEAGTTADPADTVETRARAARVRGVLADLPDRDAQILILRHSGFSYQEIATVLKVAPGSIGTLLARAEAAFETRWMEGERA